MKKMQNIIHILLTACFLLGMSFNSIGQENEAPEKRRTRLSAELVQQTDQFLIMGTLSAKKQGTKGRDYFKGMKIEVLQVTDSTENVLGSAVTDQQGKAEIAVNKDANLMKNEENYYVFEVRYEGNDSLKASTNELEAKMAFLTMDFYEEDSVRMIRFAAVQVTDEEEEGMEELDVILYSQGLFSKLKVGTAWMEGGEANMVFPTDLPGDTLGNLYLTARIEDSDEHGILEAKGSKNWALPKEVNKEIHRGLGDTDAPLWMVYTLIILLSLVWVHYFYIIFSFWLVKKEGKKAS